MQVTSETHAAEVHAGVLKVHSLSSPMLRTITAEGTTIQPLPTSLQPIAARPIMAVTYAGERWCECDLAAGFSRWHGSRSLLAVRGALARCGFDGPTTDALLSSMKRERADCPYYHR